MLTSGAMDGFQRLEVLEQDFDIRYEGRQLADCAFGPLEYRKWGSIIRFVPAPWLDAFRMAAEAFTGTHTVR